MGFQMTVMLATLIELEAIQEELPVFPSAKEVIFNLLTSSDLQLPHLTVRFWPRIKSPLFLVYFLITTMLLCMCLLVTCHTMFLNHIKPYEARNFSNYHTQVCLKVNHYQKFPDGRIRYMDGRPSDALKLQSDIITDQNI